MAVDEMLAALWRDLERDYGMDAASYLMDRPRGGWDALVTQEQLHLELEALEHRMRAEIADLRTELKSDIASLAAEMRKEMRDQTWRLTGALLVTMTVMAAMLRFS